LTLQEAIAKRRAELGFESHNQAVTAEVSQNQTETDVLEACLGKEKAQWLKDYSAKLENDPAVQRTRQILTKVAIEKARARMGFPNRE
jgi:hypothetical protein